MPVYKSLDCMVLVGINQYESQYAVRLVSKNRDCLALVGYDRYNSRQICMVLPEKH